MKKKYLYMFSTITIIFGVGSFIIFSIIGSKVLEDGTLQEPFILIPLGFLAIVLGVVVGLGRSLWALFHTPTKRDKLFFTIITFMTFGLFFYIITSMSYLTKEAQREIETTKTSYENGVWEYVDGLQLAFWKQTISADRTLTVNISETLPGAFVEEITEDGPVAIKMVLQLFQLESGKIEDVFLYLEDLEDWDDSCEFIEDKENSTIDKQRYILRPTGEALKKYQEDSLAGLVNYTCSGYGVGNSGDRYFEIHRSNPNKALFIEIGDDAPLFDKNSIVIK